MPSPADTKTHVATVASDSAPALHVFAVSGGMAATNAFMLACDETNQAVIFDAPDHTMSPMLEDALALDLDVVGLWLTHGHWDHLADHAAVTEAFPNAKVLIHELDAKYLREPGSKIFTLPFTIPAREPDGFVTDGESLSFGRQSCEVIFTPGHAPGHVMYHFASHDLLVGGDLIIGGAVGRTDLPDSSPEKLDESIRRVMQLPPQTQLLPGHGQPSTLGDERANNPYVQQALQS